MDINKANNFMIKLSTDTIQSKINWNRATEYAFLNPASNPKVDAIFQQSEFRHVIFETSYYASLPGGFIFIIHQSSESGRDGTQISGYEVYIQNDNDSPAKIHCSQGNIYQLINSIESYLAKHESTVEKFINTYFSNFQNDYK